MKQLQFAFTDDRTLNEALKRVRQWAKGRPCASMLIHVFTEILDQTSIERVCSLIRAELPQALIVGCSSNGNILNGDFSGGSFALVCTLFECPTTKVEALQYTLSADTQSAVTDRLRAELEKRPWVKGVEVLVTIRGMSVSALCEGLSQLPEPIQVFGGGAFCEDLERNEACVFTSVGGYQEKSVVFVLYGGEALHLETSFVTGWKPLGAYLHVTAADGEILKELNHRPAYETYYKYLRIQNDENFFFNTLEFPFLYRYNGIDIMRAPTASNPDGSLTMTADINQGVKARIAYGDPWTILDSAWREGNRLLTFAPECIQVFSCAARRTFWGNAEVGKETEPYQVVAPTSGFYTSGEFLRTGKHVNQHNVTQVIVAMREGDAIPRSKPDITLSGNAFEGKVSMINRMAAFIKATTDDLEQANRQLEAVNRQLETAYRRLSEMAITDPLTEIANKAAYFEHIHAIDAQIAAGTADFSVAVFDLNGLKGINDTYGHECGDLAIIDASRAMIEIFGKEGLYRIGGDEFIAILPHASSRFMLQHFEALEALLVDMNQVKNAYHMPLSLSKGFASFTLGEDTDYLQVFRRADEAMYRDKADYYRTHDRRKR